MFMNVSKASDMCKASCTNNTRFIYIFTYLFIYFTKREVNDMQSKFSGTAVTTDRWICRITSALQLRLRFVENIKLYYQLHFACVYI